MNWYIIGAGIVFTMFTISEFVSYRSAKRYEEKLRKQQRRINEKNKVIEEQRAAIEQLSRQVLNQHKTIIWLSENRQREE